MNFIHKLLYSIPAVLIAISMHEFAHGYVSYRLGDPTPKQKGRLSLNPFAHLDLVGTLCLLFFHFGWAKPVLVNPYYYKERKKGMVIVALAGPTMNFCIAFLSTFFMGMIFKITGGYAALLFSICILF
ncbi:MAG: peptidase [Clostridiales bacterium]|jgi:Zn-dependent protease|nr:peptidase [Clostridiales bacterium]